jgi:hypothetical protein
VGVAHVLYACVSRNPRSFQPLPRGGSTCLSREDPSSRGPSTGALPLHARVHTTCERVSTHPSVLKRAVRRRCSHTSTGKRSDSSTNPPTDVTRSWAHGSRNEDIVHTCVAAQPGQSPTAAPIDACVLTTLAQKALWKVQVVGNVRRRANHLINHLVTVLAPIVLTAQRVAASLQTELCGTCAGASSRIRVGHPSALSIPIGFYHPQAALSAVGLKTEVEGTA